jgi:hypothetical protein
MVQESNDGQVGFTKYSFPPEFFRVLGMAIINCVRQVVLDIPGGVRQIKEQDQYERAHQRRWRAYRSPLLVRSIHALALLPKRLGSIPDDRSGRGHLTGEFLIGRPRV